MSLHIKDSLILVCSFKAIKFLSVLFVCLLVFALTNNKTYLYIKLKIKLDIPFWRCNKVIITILIFLVNVLLQVHKNKVLLVSSFSVSFKFKYIAEVYNILWSWINCYLHSYRLYFMYFLKLLYWDVCLYFVYVWEYVC